LRRPLVIRTLGSRLARIQTRSVTDALGAAFPGLTIEAREITPHGDRVTERLISERNRLRRGRHMLRRSLLFSMALAAMLSPAVADADDWPQWRGPARDGISREKEWSPNWPADGPNVLWKTSVGAGYSDGDRYSVSAQDFSGNEGPPSAEVVFN